MARGESAESWLMRASILVSPPGGRYEVVLPSFQPDGRFLFLLAMPMFWRQHGQHAVLLCDARTPLRAYLQLAGPHDMLGDILPLHGQGVNEVVSVFRGVQGAPTAAVDFQHPEVASTFLFQPAAWAPPTFRLAETFLSDHACRWDLDESPPTFHSDPLCYLLLGQGDEQIILCLQPGPIAPQVAALVHIPCSRLVLTLQRGLFADPCIHGQPVHRAVCFRDSMCLPHPPSFALFIDAREFGATLCARVFPRLLLTVGELLYAADAHVPDGEAVVVRGGTPDPGLPHAFRFVEGDTVRLTLSDVRERSPARPPATPIDGSPTSDTETSGRYRSRSGDRADPSTRASSSSHICARLNDNRGVACDHMWTPGPSHLDVPPPHGLDDTSGGSPPCTAVVTAKPAIILARSRTIPTPCRATIHTPALDPAIGLVSVPAPRTTGTPPLAGPLGILSARSGIGYTLLEASPQRHRSEYLHRVMTFLEGGPHSTDACTPFGTVPPQCGAIEGRSPAPAPATPAVLALADHLPCREYDLTRLQVPIGKTLGDLLDFLRPWPDAVWQNVLPAACSLHPQTLRGLAQCERPELTVSQADSVCLYTDGSFDGVRSGWSVVCVLFSNGTMCSVRWLQGAVVTDDQHPAWLGARGHGAQEAELTAVCVALLWILSVQGSKYCALCSDSLVTVHRAYGDWNFPQSHCLAASCRELAQACETFGCLPWRHVSHVRAHAGDCWNEFADTLAGLIVKLGPCDASLAPLPPVGSWIRAEALGHLWLLLAALFQPQLWPTFQDSFISTSSSFEAQALPPSRFFGHVPDGHRHVQGRWTQLNVVSINVQTLECEGLHANEGRACFLREQMEGINAHIVLVQEARTPKTASVLSESYIRLCSGRTATGQLGVEAWFRRAFADASPCFRAEELTVVMFDPRVIMVRVRAARFHGLIASIHAPTSADPQRTAWWDKLARDLDRLAARSPLVLAGDWNVKFMMPRHSRVGDLVWPAKEAVPPGVFVILDRHDLWVPSTFLGTHEGPSDTWFSPGFAKPSRLDYVAVPTSWAALPGASRTLPDLDLGHSSVDHVAVFLQAWVPPRAVPTDHVRRQVAFDTAAMATPAGRAKLREVCERAPLLPWSWDASAHYSVLQEHLCSELARAFPPRPRKRSKSFLSDSTWLLKDYRSWLRKRVHHPKLLARSLDLAAAFLAWRRGRTLAAATCVLRARLYGESRRTSQYVQSLRDTKSELRQALRRDRSDYLHALASEAASMPTRDVIAKLRPIVNPGGKRKSGFAGLPAACLEDGSLAADADAARDRWIRYFAGNEGGFRASEAVAVQTYRAHQIRAEALDFDILHGKLPSRVELERAMLSTVCGKAAGPDLIPPEVLKYACGPLSRSLYQLFLKFCLRLDEALLMKGGIVHHAWKGKHGPEHCGSHRSLLISSVVGKTFHRVIRGRCIGPMLHAATPLQIGGLPKHPVLLASHCVRLYQSWQGKWHLLGCFLGLEGGFLPSLSRTTLDGVALCRRARSSLPTTGPPPCGLSGLLCNGHGRRRVGGGGSELLATLRHC